MANALKASHDGARMDTREVASARSSIPETRTGRNTTKPHQKIPDYPPFEESVIQIASLDQIMPFTFRLISSDGNARAGVVETPHGEIRTPAFMPVGTLG